MLTLATAVNFRGLKIAGTFQNVVTYSVVAPSSHERPRAGPRPFSVPQPLHTGGVGPLFQAVGVAIFLFVGFEWVTPLADEVKSPRAIPVGMFIAVVLLVLVYALVSDGDVQPACARRGAPCCSAPWPPASRSRICVFARAVFGRWAAGA